MSRDFSIIYEMAIAHARKRCPQFVVQRERFRTGEDATSALAGINGPWVELHVQCAQVATSPITGSGRDVVEENSKGFADAAFFDIHAETFRAVYEKVFATVVRVLNDQGDEVYRSDKASGVILTGRARHGMLGFPIYEQYVVAVVNESDTSIKVTFRLFVHALKMEVGDFHSRPELTPVERRFVYRRAAAFIDRLRASLASAVSSK